MSIKESALSAIQTIADTDFIRAVTSLGASRKVLASDVGKYILEDYAESELGGEQQTVKDAVDNMTAELGTLDNKADINGSYPALTSGDAEQILSTDMITDNEPYTFRQTAGGAKVGNRLFDTLVGGSVAWNQQLEVDQYWNAAGGTIVDNDGVFEVTSDGNDNCYYRYQKLDATLPNHVYLFSGDIKLDSGNANEYPNTTLLISWSGGYAVKSNPPKGSWGSVSAILKPTVAASVIAFYAFGTTSTPSGEKAQLKNRQLIDLTQMFGSTVADYIYTLEQGQAGAGVAFFRKYFPKPYYPYDAGTIKSVEGVSAHKTVGFNAFNPQNAIRGKRFGASGKATVDRATGSISDYFRVVPNTVYYAKNVSGSGIGDTFVYYDSDKNWVGTYSISGNTRVSDIFTTPSDAYYMRFQYETADEDTVCINLSWDRERNGEYEPYVEHSYPLDDSLTLRGIPKIANGKLYYDGDTYESDGTVNRRFGIVDLGSLNWTRYQTTNVFYAEPSNTKLQFHGIIPKYPEGTWDSVSSAVDKTWSSQAGAGHAIWLCDSSYSDATSLKTALNGVYLVYELATPTQFTAEPFASPQIPHSGGTEEYVTTGIVPVGHDSQYSKDLRARLEALPDDLSMIAPVEKGYTATQNYSVGAYLIVGNNFYKVTSAIANGGAITPGTNVTATTVATELIALR